MKIAERYRAIAPHVAKMTGALAAISITLAGILPDRMMEFYSLTLFSGFIFVMLMGIGEAIKTGDAHAGR